MEVSMEQVKELRKTTGAGILDCKKALADSAGDLEKAGEYLRKKGLAAAVKKLGRTTNEGLVVFSADTVAKDTPREKLGTMVSILCETDFVSRTDEFKALANDLVQEFSNRAPIFTGGAISTDQKTIGAELMKQFQEKLTHAISKIGENIQLGDYCKFESSAKSHLFHYIHHTNKIGVLLELECDKESEALTTLGKNLCLHIAALAPEYAHKEQVPATVLAKEKEIYIEQLKDSGKPQNVLEKIAEGKLQKFFEERCLLFQHYALDQNLSIQQMIKDTSKSIGSEIKVVKFYRMKIGE